MKKKKIKSINYAFKLFQKGKYKEAQKVCKQILNKTPHHPKSLFLLGLISSQLNAFDDAITYFKKSIAFDPLYADTYYNLGVIYHRTNQLDDAIANYQKAIFFEPEHAGIYYNLGCAFQSKTLYDAALKNYACSIFHKPDYAEPYNNMANIYKEIGRLSQAIACYQKAFAYASNQYTISYNLGIALQENHEYQNAIHAYKHTVSINPNHHLAYYNMGIAYGELRKTEQAIDCYRRSLAIQPDDQNAHYNLALELLITGHLQQGFKEYEWRMQKEWFPKRHAHVPLWNGQSFKDQTLLLFYEQGYGDTIQFIRYAPMVKALGGTVIFECQPCLERLLASVSGIDHVIARGKSLPSYDFQIPLMQLPKIFQTTLSTIPNKIPYIFISQVTSISAYINSYDHAFRIGLTWAGNPNHKKDQLRSCELSLFTPLSQFNDLVIFDLQKDKPISLNTNHITIEPLINKCTDFADTAEAIRALDLIITVDTATAHLAGSLGQPVWLMLPYINDWRWLSNREDSPWYPSMKLFRQNQRDDWQSVIQNIVHALRQLLIDRKKQGPNITKTPFLEKLSNDYNACLQKACHCEQMGEYQEAITLYDHLIQMNPTDTIPFFSKANIYCSKGYIDKAITLYQQCIQLAPDHVFAYFNMGVAYLRQGHTSQALKAFEHAVHIRQDIPDIHLNIGMIYQDQSRINDALIHYQHALSLNPEEGILIRSKLICPIIFMSTEEIFHWRKQIDHNISQLFVQPHQLTNPLKTCPTQFYFAYHGMNDKSVQEKIAQLYLKICPELKWTAPHVHHKKSSFQQIKIGMISKYFRNHTIGKLHEGIMRHLSKQKYQIILFRLQEAKDDIGHAIDQAVDKVILLSEHLADARQRIAYEKLDILYYPDIGMDPFTYFLAFSRLAPIQCTAWGHPVTSGIPTIDYFISPKHAEPPDAVSHYSEKLFLIDQYVMFFQKPELPNKPYTQAMFELPDQGNLYLCPQSLFKLHPDFDWIIGDILRQDRKGYLVLFEGKHDHWRHLLIKRFQQTLPDIIQQIIIHPKVSESDFLSILRLSDVLLDPIFFGGGYTTLLSFVCGTPVVTLPGPYMRSRITYGLYHQMEFYDCIAKDKEAYVAIALRIAMDKGYRQIISQSISQRVQCIVENMDGIYELERFFREVLQSYIT